MPTDADRSPRRTGIGLFSLLAFLVASSTCVHAQEGDGFDPADAFCQRQTFEITSLDEVAPWLDYVSGLRTGRSATPDADCPSTTVRAVLNVVASPSEEVAIAKRTAFHSFYTAKALQPETSERAIDADGSFRYRNDVTLAGFVWLLCPGAGEQRYACVEKTVGEFPIEFTRTSPVFCDFDVSRKDDVERVPGRSGLPLECRKTNDAELDAWMKQAAAILGE